MMGFTQLLVPLLVIGSAIASPVYQSLGDNQANQVPNIAAVAADQTVKPVGFTLSANVPGHKALSGQIQPLNTDFYINFAWASVCAPNDPECNGKYVPSLLLFDTKPSNYVTLNSTASVLGSPADSQSVYIDYNGALRYLTPPEFFTVDNTPFGNWAIAKGSKGVPDTFKFIGDTGRDGVPAAPFYACLRNTGPVFSPPQYPLVYQIYVGTKGFKDNTNQTQCTEITIDIHYTKYGGYLFL